MFKDLIVIGLDCAELEYKRLDSVGPDRTCTQLTSKVTNSITFSALTYTVHP
jgi:hypothetical protein